MILQKIKELNLIRFFKYCLVGATGTILNYVIFVFLRHIDFFIFSFYINIGWGLGILISAITNYIFNELWTFRTKQGTKK